jgi:hypothetical protein
MRTNLFILTLAAATVMPILSASACTGGSFSWRVNGTTQVQGSTRVGKPCQIRFGRVVGEISLLQTVVKPSHGVLGISAKEGSHRYIAYSPSPGFVGRDRFEIYIERTPAGGGTRAGGLQFDIDVKP